MSNCFFKKNILKIIFTIIASGYLTACTDSSSESTQTGSTVTTPSVSSAPSTSTPTASSNNTTTASAIASSTTSTAAATPTTSASTAISSPVASSSTTIATPTSSTTNTSTNSTNSSTKNILVSSTGKTVDTKTLTGGTTQSVAVGSSGNESNPALEGADMTPLTSAELAAMKLTTSAAGVQESVLGFDSRYRADPYSYPERAVASITYNGATHCTGWLVSADTLVTAGHCVHGGGSNGRWGTTASFKVFPGLDNGYAPFGSCTAKEIYSSAGWVTAADTNSDVGIIKLNCTIGNTTGYFSYFVADNLVGKTITINGYPGDKNDGNQQWASQGTISSVAPGRLYYDNDTVGGMSGSPIWTYGTNKSAWAIGIHTTGESTQQVGTNSGTRMTQNIFDLITAVKNLP